MNFRRTVIILAGGTGKRMGSKIPKQFLLLKNKPILFYCIETFYSFDKNIDIILVLDESKWENWNSLCKEHNFQIKHVLAKGGNTRFDSVKNGIQNIKYDGFVAVHDGVRPLIDYKMIATLFKDAEKYGNAVPFIPVFESFRILQGKENKTIDRSKLCLIQTPQIFKSDDLKKAYLQNKQDHFTDDASVVEDLGIKIHLSYGSSNNIKITIPLDLKIAEALL